MDKLQEDDASPRDKPQAQRHCSCCVRPRDKPQAQRHCSYCVRSHMAPTMMAVFTRTRRSSPTPIALSRRPRQLLPSDIVCELVVPPQSTSDWSSVYPPTPITLRRRPRQVLPSEFLCELVVPPQSASDWSSVYPPTPIALRRRWRNKFLESNRGWLRHSGRPCRLTIGGRWLATFVSCWNRHASHALTARTCSLLLQPQLFAGGLALGTVIAWHRSRFLPEVVEHIPRFFPCLPVRPRMVCLFTAWATACLAF